MKSSRGSAWTGRIRGESSRLLRIAERLPGSVKVTVVVPATFVPSGARAGVNRKARMTSSNFRA